MSGLISGVMDICFWKSPICSTIVAVEVQHNYCATGQDHQLKIAYNQGLFKTAFGGKITLPVADWSADKHFWSDFDIPISTVNTNTVSSSPKAKHSFPFIWSVSTNRFSRKSAYKAHFYNLSNVVTLRINPRSPKSDQVFCLSQSLNTPSSV